MPETEQDAAQTHFQSRWSNILASCMWNLDSCPAVSACRAGRFQGTGDTDLPTCSRRLTVARCAAWPMHVP